MLPVSSALIGKTEMLKHQVKNFSRPKQSLGIAILTIVLLLSVNLNGAPAENQNEKGYLEHASELISEKKYNQAILLLKKNLREMPLDSPHLFRALGRLRTATKLSWEGNLYASEIRRLLNRIPESNPGDERRREIHQKLLCRLAKHHYDRRESFAAIEVYEKALGLSTGNEKTRLKKRLASLYEEVGEFEKALEIRKQQLAESPDSRARLRQVAKLYFRLGQQEKGLGLVHDRENPALTASLARELYRAKFLNEAEQLARHARRNGQNLDRLLARILKDQKKFDEALYLLTEHYQQMNLEKRGTWRARRTTEEIAEVHRHRGTLPDAILKAEEKLAALPEGKGQSRQKYLILLYKLHAAAGKHQKALEYCLAYRKYLDEKDKRRVDSWIEKVGRPAFQRLLSRRQIETAEELLANLEKKGISGTWLDCCRYHLLLQSGQAEDARSYLAKLEEKCAEKESKIYALAEEFANWGKTADCVKLWENILESEPHNSIYDINAHVRLARYRLAKEQYSKAVEHFDAVNRSLTERSMAILHEEYFRRLEMKARYGAADRNGDILAKFLQDARPVKRRAAVWFLGRVGAPEHIEKLKMIRNGAAPKLLSLVDEAITLIQTRHLTGEDQRGPRSEKEFQDELAKIGKVLWIKEDPFAKNQLWAAFTHHFLVRAELEKGKMYRYEEEIRWIIDEVPDVTAVAFTKKRVWVGTNHGLFSYDRQRSMWDVFAIGEEPVDVKVIDVSAREDGLYVTIATNKDNKTWIYRLEKRRWEKP